MHDEVNPSPSAPWARQMGQTADLGQPVTPPGGYRVVVVDTQSCAELRDLASYRRDLELARVYAEAFGAIDRSDLETARDPRLALWVAAIISYGRAFNSGVRSTRLEASGLDQSRTDMHDYFLNLRNKHIAHAVNDYEQTVVIAYLTDSVFAKQAVTRTGQTHLDMLACEPGDPESLIWLCEHFTKGLNRRIKALHGKIATELASMGPEAVYALPDLALPDPKREKVAKRRK